MLARLLTHRTSDIDVTVFEGEDNLDLRSQGGTSTYTLKLDNERSKKQNYTMTSSNMLTSMERPWH